MTEAPKSRPMPEIMAELQAAVDEVSAERLRYGYIADTIRVNAMRHGATSEQIEAFVHGRASFVDWLANTIEVRRLSDALAIPEVAALVEAMRRIVNMGQSAEPCHWNFRVQARKIAAEAVAAAENGNMKAGTEERSSAITALAVRDSKMRTKAMREAMDIIAKIERDEMADPDGILPPDRFDEGTSAAYEAIEDAIRAAEKEAGG